MNYSRKLKTNIKLKRLINNTNDYTVSFYNVNPNSLGALPIDSGFNYENLSFGTYYAVVSDDLGCEVIASLNIGDNLNLIEATTNSYAASCNPINEGFSFNFGASSVYNYDNEELTSDGYIEIEVTGGSPPYSFASVSYTHLTLPTNREV